MREAFPWLAAAGALVALLAVMHAQAEPGGALKPSPAPAPAAPAPIPAPVVLPPRWDPGEPATAAAGRVLSILGRVEQRMQTTRYQHRTVVNERQGLYAWDCSGMAAWVLRRSAPMAQRATRRDRPVAATYFGVIDRAPAGRMRLGWEKLRHIEDARPGDVFSWLRPPDWPPRNTGHVGFVLSRPRPVPEWPGAYAVRIADATSIPHQSDTRSWPGDGGYGTGTIVFLTDGAGQATHYAWFGTHSRGAVETRVVFGRVHR